MIPSGIHELIVEMADKYIKELTEEQVLSLCPQDYGTEITDDHRSLVWDLFYNDVVDMDPIEIYDMHRRFVVGREHMGKALEQFLNAAEALKLSNTSHDWLFRPKNNTGGLN